MKSVSRLLAALAAGLVAVPATAAAVTSRAPDPVGARPAVTLVPAARAGALISLAIGATSYEIPADALAYLGRGLDPRLFSLNALLRSEADGRLPVQVGYAGRVPRLPGVTITRAAGGHAAGYLTRSSAKLFGLALARQFAADRGRGGFGTDGLFGAGVSISLAGDAVGAARPARPATGRISLTFRASDALGQPDNGGGVFLASLDNSNQLQAGSAFVRGVARFAVPAGHYFAFAAFDDFAGPFFTAVRVVVVPQITVRANLTVRTDERAARSTLTMVTPRPALPRETLFEVRRLPAAGPPISIGVSTFEVPIRVSTTSRPPSIGRLQTFTEQLLASPAAAPSPYRYLLAYQDLTGVIGSQRRLIRPAGLATVHARFISDTPAAGTVSWNGDYPAELGDAETSILFANLTDVRLPARLTEYFTAAPSLVWTIFLEGNFVLLQSGLRSYRAGTVATENWNAAPLHPAPDVREPGAALPGPLVASATRSGNVFTMRLTPFTDNGPGHLGSGFEFVPLASGRFTVDDNGRQVASGDAARSPFWQATLSPKPSAVRFVFDTVRGIRLYRLATRSHTVWTWRSAPLPSATLPGGWTCPSVFVTNLPGRRCAAEPLLALEYRVAGLSLRDSVPAGRQSVTIFVSHFQPSGSTAKITGVRVRVSFDNGRTWRHASVRRTAPNRFEATFTAPRSARFVALDVSASDAAGAAIDETLIRAYQIGTQTSSTAQTSSTTGMIIGRLR